MTLVLAMISLVGHQNTGNKAKINSETISTLKTSAERKTAKFSKGNPDMEESIGKPYVQSRVAIQNTQGLR